MGKSYVEKYVYFRLLLVWIGVLFGHVTHKFIPNRCRLLCLIVRHDLLMSLEMANQQEVVPGSMLVRGVEVVSVPVSKKGPVRHLHEGAVFVV